MLAIPSGGPKRQRPWRGPSSPNWAGKSDSPIGPRKVLTVCGKGRRRRKSGDVRFVGWVTGRRETLALARLAIDAALSLIGPAGNS
jgi:hypothetical protein